MLCWWRRRPAAWRQASEHHERVRGVGSGPPHSPHPCAVTETLRDGVMGWWPVGCGTGRRVRRGCDGRARFGGVDGCTTPRCTRTGRCGHRLWWGRFRGLVRRTITAEQALRRRDSGHDIEARLIWLDLKSDEYTGWSYADLFRQHLGVEHLVELMPPGPAPDDRRSVAVTPDRTSRHRSGAADTHPGMARGLSEMSA